MAESDIVKLDVIRQAIIGINAAHSTRFQTDIINPYSINITPGNTISVDELRRLLDTINTNCRVADRISLPDNVASGNSITKAALVQRFKDYEYTIATASCGSGCTGGCITTCSGSCARGCSTDCSGGCSNSCAGDCKGGCLGTCYNGSQQPNCINCGQGCHGGLHGCNWGCHGCEGNCTGDCDGECKGTCHHNCGNVCYDSCRSGCALYCSSCSGSCLAACSQNCYDSCRGRCAGAVN